MIILRESRKIKAISNSLNMQDWLSKLMGSIQGILIGLILFVVSIGLLYWNEGRVDISSVADKAVEISATEQSTEAEGQLISTSGKITTEDLLGDTYLQAGNYIAVRRNVEMYAWDESSETKSKTTNGENYVDVDENNASNGSEKTYIYNKVWTSNPDDSAGFKFPAQHQNPQKPLPDKTVTVENAKIGIYEVDLDKAQLPGFDTVSLSEGNTMLDKGLLTEDDESGMAFFESFEDIAPTLESDKYIYKGFGTLENPEVGDIRISYSVLPADQDVTVFGQQSGTKITTYIGEKNSKLYRIFSGTRSEALSQMSTEHTTMTWGLRLLGFVLMWIGLGMLLGPISAVLDFVPLVGQLSKTVIGIATFIVAAILSALVIWISMVMHNIVAIIVVVVVIIGIILMILKQKSQK